MPQRRTHEVAWLELARFGINRTAVALLLLVTSVGGHAAASVYTWTDAQGVVHFSDKADAAQARPAHLNLRTQPASPSPANDTRSSSAASSPGEAQVGPPERSHIPRILMPSPGATIGNPQDKVIVSVAIGNDEALAENETLVYRLDGRVLADAPSKATRLAVDNLGPGRHQIDVMLQENGRDTGRQDSVAFTVQAEGAQSARNTSPAAGADRGASGRS